MAGVKGRSGGQNRKPTALKVLHGTDQPCRRNPDEPLPEPGAPPKPGDLEPAVAAEWDRWVPLLVVELRTLTPADGRAFLQLCRSCVRADEAWDALRAAGETQETEKSGTVRSAEARVYDQANAEVMRWCSLFGATPSDRARVKAPPKAAPATAKTAAELRRERMFGA